jgi:Galactose oxidase, central domain
MKKSLLLLIWVYSLCVLSACGGGSAGSPPGPATHFSVTAPPTATAGAVFMLTVIALDASNNMVTTYSGTTRFTSTDSQAVLPANSTLTNGTGTFSATLKTAGSQTITVTDTVTASITGTSSSITIALGPPSHLSLTAPATATAGTAFSFTVTALDASNNMVTSYSGTVHFTSTDAQALLPANSTLTNGTRTFTATLKTAGSQTITVTDTVTASITGTSNSINVIANAATHFSLTAPATATAGTAFSFTVTALDASNNMVTSYSGTVHFTSTDSQAVLAANSTLTNGTGTFSAALKTVGSQTIAATDTVTASITGTSNAINVTTNQATHFSANAPPSVTSQKSFNFTVTALDASNNIAITYSGTTRFTSTDSQAVLPANSTLTNGTGTFSATLKTVGSQTITATDTVTASITGTSNAIGVFTSCGGQRANCGAAVLPPCCPGFVCSAASTRAFCERDPSASVRASRFALICRMETARESHTATLLSNGLVLITGGDDRTVSLATAELFNPDTRSFAPTGDMANARANHTSTLLTSTAVLVVGGRDASGNALATAELFDPAHGSFTPTGSMSVARESHTATLLGNGNILIAGGENGGVTLATAELFDSARGIFVQAGNMSTARGFHTATLLKNGKVLVIGGRGANGNVVATAELFDPTSGSFMPAGSMHTPRESHTATLLGDGKILITGGDDGTESLATAELFDPTSGSFTPTGRMQAAREFHTATLRNDGTVLVAGGAEFTSKEDGSARAAFLPESIATAELFNPASGSFTPANDMADARARHTAILLPDGVVLLTGGINPDISALADSLASAELFQ